MVEIMAHFPVTEAQLHLKQNSWQLQKVQDLSVSSPHCDCSITLALLRRLAVDVRGTLLTQQSGCCLYLCRLASTRPL